MSRSLFSVDLYRLTVLNGCLENILQKVKIFSQEGGKQMNSNGGFGDTSCSAALPSQVRYL